MVSNDVSGAHDCAISTLIVFHLIRTLFRTIRRWRLGLFLIRLSADVAMAC